MTDQEKPYVEWFRNSAPYINAHRNKTVVLMVSGEAVAHPNFINIVHDVALLSSLGVKLVIVHGARPQIDQALASQGVASRLHRNLRVTDKQALGRVKSAVGLIRSDTPRGDRSKNSSRQQTAHAGLPRSAGRPASRYDRPMPSSSCNERP